MDKKVNWPLLAFPLFKVYKTSRYLEPKPEVTLLAVRALLFFYSQD
jgi:hypothetical protein